MEPSRLTLRTLKVFMISLSTFSAIERADKSNHPGWYSVVDPWAGGKGVAFAELFIFHPGMQPWHCVLLIVVTLSLFFYSLLSRYKRAKAKCPLR